MTTADEPVSTDTMADTIQLIEPHEDTREVVVRHLRELNFQVVASGSVDEAAAREPLRKATVAVFADLDAVRASRETWHDFIIILGGGRSSRTRPKRKSKVGDAWDASNLGPLILLSKSPLTAARQQEAIKAGAVYLVEEKQIRECPDLLNGYLRHALHMAKAPMNHWPTVREDSAPVDKSVAGVGHGTTTDAPPAAPADASANTVARAFGIGLAEIRDPASGLLDAKLLKAYLGSAVSLKEIAKALKANYTTVDKTPHGPALQRVLEEFESVLALASDAMDGDRAKVRAWLQTPRPELRDNTPLSVMLTPGHIAAVVELVSSAWLGEPE